MFDLFARTVGDASTLFLTFWLLFVLPLTVTLAVALILLEVFGKSDYTKPISKILVITSCLSIANALFYLLLAVGFSRHPTAYMVLNYTSSFFSGVYTFASMFALAVSVYYLHKWIVRHRTPLVPIKTD